MSKCLWIGSGEGCSHNSVNLRSYCDQHIWRVYQEGTRLNKRTKDKRTAATVQFWESMMNDAVEELEAEGWDFRIGNREVFE